MEQTRTRTVTWGGLHNARDLGGLPAGPRTTAPGRFFRAPRLDGLDVAGWDELVAAGVRTVVDLRNADEIAPLDVPATVTRHHLPIEDQAHVEFMSAWGNRLNSPVYYRANLGTWPDRFVALFHTFAGAPEGGIVFHCSAGRDRTGMVSAMLLSLVGVDEEEIVADYAAGVVAVNEHYAHHPHPHEVSLPPEALAPWLNEVRSHLREFLRLDVATYLVENGLPRADLETVRSRLLS